MNPILLAQREIKLHKRHKSSLKSKAEFLFSLLVYSKVKQNSSEVQNVTCSLRRIHLLLEEHSHQLATLTSIQQTDTLRITALEEERAELQLKVKDLLYFIETLQREHTCELLQHRNEIEKTQKKLEHLNGERTKFFYLFDLAVALLTYKIVRSTALMRWLRSKNLHLGGIGEIAVLFFIFKGLKGAIGNGKVVASR
jgi:hypothetical protein